MEIVIIFCAALIVTAILFPNFMRFVILSALCGFGAMVLFYFFRSNAQNISLGFEEAGNVFASVEHVFLVGIAVLFIGYVLYSKVNKSKVVDIKNDIE